MRYLSKYENFMYNELISIEDKIKDFIHTTIEEGIELVRDFDYNYNSLFDFDYDSLSDTANIIVAFIDEFDTGNEFDDDNLDFYFINVMRDNIEILQDNGVGIGLKLDSIEIATNIIYDHLKKLMPDVDEKYDIYINQKKYNL